MPNHLLEMKDVKKSYGGTQHALCGINLTVDQGEFIVIIGPSGAGKSTLIRCINQLVNSSSGEVIFNGTRMDRAKGKELKRQRTKIGMIFQHYNLIGQTSVIKNVLHGCLGNMSFLKSMLGLYTEQDKLEAVALLKEVGLEKHMYKKASALSGGQMQRVGICRALLQHPSLLLADEPIASLDPKSAKVVMTHLKRTTKERGLTCIVNLHQVDIAKKYATRIIGVHAGKVVFDDLPSKLTEEKIQEIYDGKPIVSVETELDLEIGIVANG